MVNSGRKPQVVWSGNAKSSVKKLWRSFAFVFQRHSFMWQILIIGIAFVTFHISRDPLTFIYVTNNTKRTYKVAIEKERAYKKKKLEE
jgi:hypothetical protein